ncbi:DUF2147 domain-containing protein [Massilia arenosa]|uniref:DUF2147 domain-containing protein n=1 Tax=Zemynaea arenosa TaxID=2561931 RepID=A0A4Y9S3S7_9BURK|nr:DUF2147 domain-containing protein [Massilia arenosa]TFW16164.1 DUF2147 domain-containing protein [Massilia arenosa]
MRTSILAACAAAVLALPSAWAQDTPVGLWKNIDDQTGQPKALIRISDNNGVLEGRIEKLFRPTNEDQNPKCVKCEGQLKDQPIIGMTILNNLRKDGNEYNGGTILDPGNGKTYKSKLKLVDGGKKLDVRGYIGMPMLGRTQTWVRQE